eukprot:scaffold33511_cov31-Prasinocladus_malaysianus.AAC.1
MQLESITMFGVPGELRAIDMKSYGPAHMHMKVVCKGRLGLLWTKMQGSCKALGKYLGNDS